MNVPVRVEPLTMLGRFRREPLVHFLLIGLLLFAVYGLMGRGSGDRNIRVDGGVVAALEAQFQAAWKRPPTPSERKVLIELVCSERNLLSRRRCTRPGP